MFNGFKRSLSPLAVAALLGAGVSAVPVVAFAQTPVSHAKAEKDAEKPVDKAEARIKEMHAKLKITAAQDPAWEDFVKAQRDNAQQMSALIQKREESADSMNAVDDFKNYQEIAQAHADGLNKIVPAFEKLYGSLSDEQKKMADSMFRGAPGKKAS
jgi:Spy/CpxP family protein refolding chaperone